MEENCSGQFGRFRLLELLGRNLRRVYKAYDPQLDRTVTLVVMPADQHSRKAIEPVMKAAKLATRLRHPGILSVHEVGAVGDLLYYTMDFVEGRSLGQLLREKGRLPVEESLRIVVAVAEALHYLHSNGAVHLDVTAENVRIEADGRVLLCGYGESAVEMEGVIMGTPHYMSPEQVSGAELDGRSDVWSLGVILYETLCGARPFEGETLVRVLHGVCHDEPIPPREREPELDERAEAIILKCLEKNVEARYASAAELKDDIERLVHR